MGTIDELYEAFGRLRLKEKLPELIKKTEYPMVLKLIGQHKRGEQSTTEKITPSYAGGAYAKFKNLEFENKLDDLIKMFVQCYPHLIEKKVENGIECWIFKFKV